VVRVASEHTDSPQSGRWRLVVSIGLLLLLSTALAMEVPTGAPALVRQSDPPGEIVGPLTPPAVGPIQIGMTKRQAEQASGVRFTRPGPFCAKAVRKARGVALEFTHGRVAAIVVAKRAIGTAAGIRVGDSVEQVRSTYGEAVSVNGVTQAGGERLVLTPPDPAEQAYRIVFWADTSGRVVLMAAGSAGDVENRVEFCA